MDLNVSRACRAAAMDGLSVLFFKVKERKHILSLVPILSSFHTRRENSTGGAFQSLEKALESAFIYGFCQNQ